jgi:hypothetical protein
MVLVLHSDFITFGFELHVLSIDSVHFKFLYHVRFVTQGILNRGELFGGYIGHHKQLLWRKIAAKNLTAIIVCPQTIFLSP